MCVDLTDWEATKTAVENLGDIDLLVNTAGVQWLKPFVDTDEETIDR